MVTERQGLEIIADVIRAHYDFDEVGIPAPLEAAHQRRHRKLVLPTSEGKFLVKTYHRDLAVLDNLRFQHRLSEHLAQHGLPVARIKKTNEGKGIAESDDWALELQSFVEGAGMLSVDKHTLSIAAQALGRFHQACDGVRVPPRDARMWRFSEVPRTTFQTVYQLARQESGGSLVDRQCNDIALFLHHAGEALDISRRNEFETGLIHGDWHGGNLLFHEGKLTAIVDLEFAGDGCYLEDIAYGISNLCIRTTTDEAVLEARTNLFLDQYQLSRTLSYAEKVALYFAVGVKHVATVSYQIKQQGGKVAGLSAAQWMERLDLQCKWLEAESKKARWGH